MKNVQFKMYNLQLKFKQFLHSTFYILHSQQGFTLIEVILSLAIVAILTGLSLPVYRTLMTKNDLDIATVTVVQSLRRAQTLSQAVDGDTNWGVKVQSGGITVFKGTSYAARDATYDETFVIPDTITTGGVTETVYSKLFGAPQTTGTVTLATDEDLASIILNSKGMVSY
ncbi:MAG TPA: type II secretion system protein [Patescibacteria group bacterium]|nr:type II secretion system protein [Patescibacteria group bacterium]